MGKIRELLTTICFSLVIHWSPIIVLSALVVLGLVLALVAAFCSDDWMGLMLNLGTEMIGAVVVYILLQVVVGRNVKRRELIAQMSSTVHDLAIAAVEEMRRQGWLTDGSLRFKFIHSSDLRGADFRHADLRGADLYGMTLQGVDLWKADLWRAGLRGVDLRRALLWDADLRGAHLLYVNLREATLQGAHLEGSDFDKESILPDGNFWTPDTDMARFTNPRHLKFYRSPALDRLLGKPGWDSE